jgi:hypothetical protein
MAEPFQAMDQRHASGSCQRAQQHGIHLPSDTRFPPQEREESPCAATSGAIASRPASEMTARREGLQEGLVLNEPPAGKR